MAHSPIKRPLRYKIPHRPILCSQFYLATISPPLSLKTLGALLFFYFGLLHHARCLRRALQLRLPERHSRRRRRWSGHRKVELDRRCRHRIVPRQRCSRASHHSPPRRFLSRSCPRHHHRHFFQVISPCIRFHYSICMRARAHIHAYSVPRDR